MGYAVAFSLYVGALSLLRGSVQYDRYQMSAWSIVATYFAVGLAGGIALGLLRPLTRWALGVAFVGWVVGTLVYGGIAIVMKGFNRQQVIDGMVLGALVGPIAAVLLRRKLK
jgi:hypothetical protein